MLDIEELFDNTKFPIQENILCLALDLGKYMVMLQLLGTSFYLLQQYLYN